MKGRKWPKVTSWRAFVDGKQIGSGYATELQALEAAQEYIENEPGAHTLPYVKPSFAPTPEPI